VQPVYFLNENQAYLFYLGWTNIRPIIDKFLIFASSDQSPVTNRLYCKDFQTIGYIVLHCQASFVDFELEVNLWSMLA